MAQGGLVDRVARSPVAATVAIVADVSAVLVVANTTSAKSWLSSNPLIMLLIGGVLICFLVATFNRWMALRATVRSLEARLREPSKQDIDRYLQFLHDMGPETDVVSWLKHGFINNLQSPRHR